MKRSTRSPESFASFRRAVLACSLAAGLVPQSSTADVVGTFVINGDGTVTYFYRVDNTAGTFDISLWSLEFDFPILDWNPLDTLSGGDVTVPDANWFADAGTPITGLSSQDFLSLDPIADVTVGSTLGGFSFTSQLLPGPVTYYEFSALGDSASGTTLGPVSVIPEGRSWTIGLALAGAGCLTALKRARRDTGTPAS